MSDKVLEYIEKHPQWKEILTKLREIITEFPLEETIKWGAPVFVFNQKNCVGLAAFKNYCGLWFFQGALLHDEKKFLSTRKKAKPKQCCSGDFFQLMMYKRN